MRPPQRGLGRGGILRAREDEPEVARALRQRHQPLPEVRRDHDVLDPGHRPRRSEPRAPPRARRRAESGSSSRPTRRLPLDRRLRHAERVAQDELLERGAPAKPQRPPAETADRPRGDLERDGPRRRETQLGVDRPLPQAQGASGVRGRGDDRAPATRRAGARASRRSSLRRTDRRAGRACRRARALEPPGRQEPLERDLFPGDELLDEDRPGALAARGARPPDRRGSPRAGPTPRETPPRSSRGSPPGCRRETSASGRTGSGTRDIAVSAPVGERRRNPGRRGKARGGEPLAQHPLVARGGDRLGRVERGEAPATPRCAPRRPPSPRRLPRPRRRRRGPPAPRRALAGIGIPKVDRHEPRRDSGSRACSAFPRRRPSRRRGAPRPGGSRRIGTSRSGGAGGLAARNRWYSRPDVLAAANASPFSCRYSGCPLPRTGYTAGR